ncbi:hypothetical protein GF415_03550 [Candidatus Micrarchaeota archaeon]|nr:hypothetical protein [Candidatus Micrarchaeota archaeon]
MNELLKKATVLPKIICHTRFSLGEPNLSPWDLLTGRNRIGNDVHEKKVKLSQRFLRFLKKKGTTGWLTVPEKMKKIKVVVLIKDIVIGLGR